MLHFAKSYTISVYSHVSEGIEETRVRANANIRDSEKTVDKHVIANYRFATTYMDACVQVTIPNTVDMLYG